MELGKVYGRFTSKKGNEVIFKTPQWEDLDLCLEFINKISKEDTFITFSGEEIKREEEIDWLSGAIRAMEKRDALYLVAFIGERLIGNCELKRMTSGRNRTKHVGHLGITIDEGFREEGIGTEMLNILIGEAKGYGLKILTLTVFANNTRAIHTYEKVGFKKCGEIPKGIFYKDRHIGEILMFQEVE